MPDYYSDLYNPSNGYGLGSQPQQQTAQEDNPWINNFATRGALTGIQYLGETLGKPQQALYGLASGLMKGDVGEGLKSLANLIPFSDTLGITNTPGGLTEKRLSGRDLLRQAGVADSEDTWGNFGAGLALDIAADPLAFVRGPLGALTKAGEAASKAGTLERTLAGRITSGQGGWAAIADRPWYAELIPGVGRQENAAVLGMGKYGQAAAEGMDKGWSAATRATIPGTDVAPVAWLRSAFEKGAGNVSGYAPIVDEFGKTVAPRTQALESAARESALPLGQAQAEALNELQRLGMNPQESALALRRASASQRELGEAKIPTNATPEQQQVIKGFSDFYDKTIGGIVDPQAAAARQVGYEIEQSPSIWGHRYNPRNQADTGNRAGSQAMQRSDLLAKMPGGEVQVERFLSDPEFSGFANRKVAGQAYDGIAIEAQKKAKTQEVLQDMIAEGNAQAGRLQARGGKLHPDAEKLLANPDEMEKVAKEFVDYASKLDPKIAERGYFYRQDPYLGAANYGTGLATIRAVREGSLEVLAKEGKDIGQMLTKATNVADVVSLKDAIDQLGMKGAEQELLKRTVLGSIDDLASRGVDKKLIDKLSMELSGPKAPGSVSKAFSDLTSAFRYGVTIPFPANFVRNWTGELANQAVSGTSPIKNLTTATSYLNRTLTDPANLAKAQQAYEAGVTHGILAQGNVHELLGTGVTGKGDIAFNIAKPQAAKTTAQIGRDFAEPIFSEAKRTEMGMTPLRAIADNAPPTVKKIAEYAGKVIDPARGYAAAMETGHVFQNEATRLQQIMNFMEEGYSAEAAAKRVGTIQRRYDQLTPFESSTMRNVVPFYNFSVSNLKSQADMLFRDPGRYNAMLSTINSGRSDDSFVPSWASSGTAIPLPGAPEGSKRFLGSLGLPVEDETIGSLGALLSGHPIEALRRMASGSNPAIKTPYEMATGRQIFSGRDLADLRPSPVISGIMGDNQFSRGLTEALTGTPLSRAFSTVDRLASTERNGVLATLLNLGTGLRSVDVNQDQASSIAARDMIERLMKESGNFKSREQVYLKPELKGQEQDLPPEIQALIQYHKILDQKAQAAAKAKASR